MAARRPAADRRCDRAPDVARRRPSRPTPRCASSSRSRAAGSRCSRSPSRRRADAGLATGVRERARAVVGRDDARAVARARARRRATARSSPGLVAALARLRARSPRSRIALDDRDRARTARGARDRCRRGGRGAARRSSRCSRTSSSSGAAPAAPRAGRARAAAIASASSCGASRSPTARSRCSTRTGRGRRAAVAARAGDRAAAVGRARAVPVVAQRARAARASSRRRGASSATTRRPASGSPRCRPRTPTPRTTPPTMRSPYPGLAAYGVGDAERFVGREREIEALANRLVRAPLIAVLGPSGVGKSSFIHAGVLPRLGEHYRDRHDAAGPPSACTRSPRCRRCQRRHPRTAPRSSRAPARARRERAARLVIVDRSARGARHAVRRSDERTRFAEMLARAADGPSAPVRVVVTLRDDFATRDRERGRAARPLRGVRARARRRPRRCAGSSIEPARRAAVTVEPRVVDDMVAEVAGRPASLPLLSFTGVAAVGRARSRGARRSRTTRTSRSAASPARSSTYADQVYDSLARRDQDIVRDLFARLVAADGTRIPAPRAELEQLAGARARARAPDRRAPARRARRRRRRRRRDRPRVPRRALAAARALAQRGRRRSRAARRRPRRGAALAARRGRGRICCGAARRSPSCAGSPRARRCSPRTSARSPMRRDRAERARADAAALARRRRDGRRSPASRVVMAYLGVAREPQPRRGRAQREAARDAAKLAEDRLTAEPDRAGPPRAQRRPRASPRSRTSPRRCGAAPTRRRCAR